MKFEQQPDYLVNVDDLSCNFWKRDYIVYVTAQGISFLVNAGNEGDALDYVMDCIVDLGLVGLYSEDYQDDDDYTTAGNYGYSFTTHNIHIVQL